MWQVDENVDFFLAGIAAVRVADGSAYVHLGCRIPLFSMEESADQRRVHLCIGDQDPCRNAAHLLVAFAVKGSLRQAMFASPHAGMYEPLHLHQQCATEQSLIPVCISLKKKPFV